MDEIPVIDKRWSLFPPYVETLAKLETFIADVLAETAKPDGACEARPEVSVYVYGDEKTGLRIGEIGAFWPTAAGPRTGSGVSWMRSDGADCGATLLCAEDFVLDYDAPGDPPGYDPAAEARWRLAFALTGSDEIAGRFSDTTTTKTVVYAVAFRHRISGEGVGGFEWDVDVVEARRRVRAVGVYDDPSYEVAEETFTFPADAVENDRDSVTIEIDAKLWNRRW